MLAFVAIFSLGPFLLPFVTLLVGVCACRRAAPATIATGVAVGLLGIAAALAVSPDAFLLTPLATLAIGLSPALPREASGAVAGAALAGAALGGPPPLLLAAVAGVVAFPLLRRPSSTPLRG